MSVNRLFAYPYLGITKQKQVGFSWLKVGNSGFWVIWFSDGKFCVT